VNNLAGTKLCRGIDKLEIVGVWDVVKCKYVDIPPQSTYHSNISKFWVAMQFDSFYL